MPSVKLQHVVSCSSEDKVHCADNLLKGDSYKKWKCAVPGEKQMCIVLQFEKASAIHSIDIGNEGSAFIEVFVGRSTDTEQNYQVILVASSFMSPKESREGISLNRVRMFGLADLSKVVIDEKWDRVKVVCTQPFNKHIQYGLSFIRFNSAGDVGQSTSATEKTTEQKVERIGSFTLKPESDESTLKVGSLFATRHAHKEEEVKGAAAVRAASRDTSVMKQPTPVVAGAAKQTPLTAKPTAESKHELVRESAKKTAPNTKEDQVKSKEAKRKATVREATPPPTKKQKSVHTLGNSSSQTPVDFNSIMKGVFFSLSGFQNPLRGQLREKALEMGAKYRPDWTKECTHLVCAFINTPKYVQVKQEAGKIVTQEWVTDCYGKRQPLSWKKYELKSDSEDSEEEEERRREREKKKKFRRIKNRVIDDSDEESEENEESEDEWRPADESDADEDIVASKKDAKSPKKSTKNAKSPKKSPKDARSPDKTSAEIAQTFGDDDDNTGRLSSSGEDTEDEINRIKDEEQKAAIDEKGNQDQSDLSTTDMDSDDGIPKKPDLSSVPLPDLPSFFSGKHFFLYGDFTSEQRRQIVRHIVAFNGAVDDYMNAAVSYVVTSSEWDKNFDDALSENSSLQFVKPKWIFDCSEKGRFLPHQPYIIIPAI